MITHVNISENRFIKQTTKLKIELAWLFLMDLLSINLVKV